MARLSVMPVYRALSGLIAALLGQPIDSEPVRMHAASVFGQCIIYRTSQSIIERIYDNLGLQPPSADRIADHVTAFSLAAIHPAANTTASSRPDKSNSK